MIYNAATFSTTVSSLAWGITGLVLLVFGVCGTAQAQVDGGNNGISDELLAVGLEVPMTQSAGGTLYLKASATGIEDEFMLDTGAGMVTLSETLLARLKTVQRVEHVRQMAARLANNRLRRIDVYRINDFRVGNCYLGDVEVAVMEGGSRNLLGLSALRLAAPFAIQLSPPVLSLSHCGLNNIASLGG